MQLVEHTRIEGWLQWIDRGWDQGRMRKVSIVHVIS